MHAEPTLHGGQITPRELSKIKLAEILPPQAAQMLRDAAMRDPDEPLGQSLERSMALTTAEGKVRELWPERFA